MFPSWLYSAVSVPVQLTSIFNHKKQYSILILIVGKILPSWIFPAVPVWSQLTASSSQLSTAVTGPVQLTRIILQLNIASNICIIPVNCTTQLTISRYSWWSPVNLTYFQLNIASNICIVSVNWYFNCQIYRSITMILMKSKCDQ